MTVATEQSALLDAWWDGKLAWALLIDRWPLDDGGDPAGSEVAVRHRIEKALDNIAATPIDTVDDALRVLAQHGETYRRSGQYWTLVGTDTMRSEFELIRRAGRKLRGEPTVPA